MSFALVFPLLVGFVVFSISDGSRCVMGVVSLLSEGGVGACIFIHRVYGFCGVWVQGERTKEMRIILKN